MSKRELSEMREKITALIDDIKYQSDNLTDLERLPIIQLKVLLAKISSLSEQTAVLTHYVEKRGRLSDIVQEDEKEEAEEIVVAENPVEAAEEEVVEEIEQPSLPDEEIQQASLPVEEQPANVKEGNVEDRLKKMVVTDLNSAIGINEKYLYSSELFGGSTEALTDSVKMINDLQQLNEAQDKIAELAATYNWDLENQTVKTFIELIERKFDQP